MIICFCFCSFCNLCIYSNHMCSYLYHDASGSLPHLDLDVPFMGGAKFTGQKITRGREGGSKYM